VILIASDEVDDFAELKDRSEVNAGTGRPGLSGKKTGRNGDDVLVRVPPGTIVRRSEDESVILRELTEPGDRVVIARGGPGGRGNRAFASSTNRTPREYGSGERGEEISVKLDLKMIADIGLVGFPNAGKSTLLSVLTGANPRIGGYPFTTLEPNRGTLVFDDYREAVVADIPGIIEHASDGAGLGNTFLKHIERTAVAVHCIECGSFMELSPLERYYALRRELDAFGPGVSDKPEVPVLTKTDLVGDAGPVLDAFRSEGIDPVPVSSLSGEGLDELKLRIQDECDRCTAKGSGDTL
jgi:GTP-binding protein